MPELVTTVEVVEAYHLAAKTASGVPGVMKLKDAYSLFENALRLEAKLADKELVMAVKKAKKAVLFSKKDEQAYKLALAAETAKAIKLSAELEAILASKLAVLFMGAKTSLGQELAQIPPAMVPPLTLANAFELANETLQAAVLKTVCRAANVLYIKAAEQEASVPSLSHKP